MSRHMHTGDEPQAVMNEAFRVNGLSPMARDEMYLLVDTNIQDLQGAADRALASARSWKTYRNSLSPVNRLPPELLANVFHIVGHDNQSRSIIASHVCRAWRFVALDCAKLWTSISFYDENRADEFLRRSKNHAIDVKIKGVGVLGMLSKVTPHFHRIRCLTIRVPQAVVMQTALKKLRGSAPLLRKLSLSVYADGIGPGVGRIYCPEIPPFGGDTPSLQSVSLRAVSLPLQSPTFKNLTHLKFMDQYDPTLLPEPLLEVLAHCPRLCILHIWFKSCMIDTPRATETATRDRMVALPDLSELELSYMPRWAVPRVLAQLSLPGPTKIVIRSLVRTDDPYQILRADCSAIRSLCNFKTIQFLVFPRMIDIRAYADVEAPLAEPCLRLRLEYATPEIAMRELPSAFNLSTVETFTVSDLDLPLSRLHVTSILGSMINLRTLRMVNTFQKTVYKALLVLPNPYTVGSEPDSREVLCSRLESLEIVGGLFTSTMKDALIRCIEKYSAIGHPIQTVNLKEVRGWELTEIEKLKTMTREVHVNE